ncbi:hypothetical protein [Amycolatopsis sp. H20-H5]|uniref:hypothetical protein n=1 Tax=Amycolatopsis sp. H20-H5 TaxID=3046309 RepID=UPI002DBF7C5C|nr:hypothetical protein [Amycolatopsis sp. H20-H5]MEC3977095.1 hypothetical protein [Amycolatopsis sp. H20-H5]
MRRLCVGLAALRLLLGTYHPLLRKDFGASFPVALANTTGYDDIIKRGAVPADRSSRAR